MSQYKDFSRCIICRTKINMEEYYKQNGKYEVTMLINSLYITVLYPLEKRRDMFDLDICKIEKYLLEQGIANDYRNGFAGDEYLRQLRNGLAHLNIETTDRNRNIEAVIISAEYRPFEPHCGRVEKCTDKKCLGSRQYNKHDNAICTFTFTVEQLREFAYMLINMILETPASMCRRCAVNS